MSASEDRARKSDGLSSSEFARDEHPDARAQRLSEAVLSAARAVRDARSRREGRPSLEDALAALERAVAALDAAQRTRR